MCARCRRPQSVCYCAALPTLETTTRIVILQHPREKEKPIGTARMASLCLPRAELHVGLRWDASLLGDHPILLYPGPGAKDILTEPPVGPVTLIVVDGTWSQAKTVVRDNPALQALPRYAFHAPEPSIYRIRKEPKAEYCSTLEALMHVLGALEGDAAKFRALLAPMNAMIEAQLAAQAGSARRDTVRQPKPPRPPKRPLPADVIARRADLVVLAGEANAWPYAAGAQSPRDELVHVVAHRLATGETLSRVIAPERALSPTTTFHARLSEERLRAGSARGAAIADLAAFLRPTDLVCTWGHYGAQLVAESGGALPPRIDLRAAAYAHTNKKIGALEDYARSLGDVTPVAEGRGGHRAACLARILTSWLG
ncbi:MAG: DTW domain-containing protein [Myxococcales bacterium]|nr:DTW domain-containing protein [Myxococcales bacterium]